MAKKTFVGEETWNQSGTKTGVDILFEYRFADGEILVPKVNNEIGAIQSNHYLATSADSTYLLNVGISIHRQSDTLGYIHIYNGMTSTADFKAYLAENPLVVHYVLATPIETALSEVEIEAFKTLVTNYPSTTILNDSGANMMVRYGIDTKTYIDKKFAELQAALS